MGFGLLSEQGAESIHAHFNSLKRTYSEPAKTDDGGTLPSHSTRRRSEEEETSPS